MRTILLSLPAISLLMSAHSAIADPASDYQQVRDEYVRQAAFIFRKNMSMRFVHMDYPEAVVAIRYALDGTFENVALTERSGDPAFDMAGNLAVPPPPAQVAERDEEGRQLKQP
jgi:hypothetical protein